MPAASRPAAHHCRWKFDLINETLDEFRYEKPPQMWGMNASQLCAAGPGWHFTGKIQAIVATGCTAKRHWHDRMQYRMMRQKS
ncbi:hypothetical protein K227x_58040 [Rubripirellula lacrimiformis]|uniref:Uncharacterized protein n=1 Tax=Rubripirellula lacrimiformis TaxID=1930273 RepID=A0A517NJR4_9BACT|nr:hypothetical protein [Rubripirellula lacrimiformis]QDT07377.1 hypothetical protein K227x_58040 [Rubripirellula lacrimiformis]